MGTGAGSVSLSQFPPTDSKKGGLGSASTRQTPHLPAPLSYKGLTQASIGFRFILFLFPVCFGIEKKNITERKQPERASGAGLPAGERIREGGGRAQRPGRAPCSGLLLQ